MTEKNEMPQGENILPVHDETGVKNAIRSLLRQMQQLHERAESVREELENVEASREKLLGDIYDLRSQLSRETAARIRAEAELAIAEKHLGNISCELRESE